MEYEDGEKYEGEWKKNLKDGKGILIYKNKEIIEGFWKNDILVSNNLSEEKNNNIKYCKIKNHEKNNIIAYCIDSDCEQKNKLLCFECIFTIHNQHKIIKIEEIDQLFMKKINKNISVNYCQNITEKFKELKKKC